MKSRYPRLEHQTDTISDGDACNFRGLGPCYDKFNDKRGKNGQGIMQAGWKSSSHVLEPAAARKFLKGAVQMSYQRGPALLR